MKLNLLSLIANSRRVTANAREARDEWLRVTKIDFERTLQLRLADADRAKRDIGARHQQGIQAAEARLKARQNEALDRKEAELKSGREPLTATEGESLESLLNRIITVQENFETAILHADSDHNVELQRLNSERMKKTEAVDTTYQVAVAAARDTQANGVTTIHNEYKSVRSKRNKIWLKALTGEADALKEMQTLVREALH